MANISSRSNHQNKPTTHFLALFSVMMLAISQGGAFEFKIGGSKGWSVPSDPNGYSYNKWAERNRFHVNDTLLFVYSADQDSVLRVTKESYDSCNTGSFLEKFTDGHTVYKFKQSGPHYFISGVEENCKKGEKVEVVVMADRSSRTITASPPPSGSTAVPSPAPSVEEAPTPPGGMVEINPSPAPSQENPAARNSAASIYVSFVGVIGTFVSSFMLLSFF